MSAVLKLDRRTTYGQRAPLIEPRSAATAQVFAELLLARWMAPPRLQRPDPSFPQEDRVMLDTAFAHRPIDWGRFGPEAIQLLLNRR